MASARLHEVGAYRASGTRSVKTVLTDTGKIGLEVPRDRLSSFDPPLIAKYQRRFPGFDEKIVSMYARGMTTRKIQGHVRDLYGIDVSPDLISAVTDAVLEEVTAWQNRPLVRAADAQRQALYPLIFFDAIRIKVRDEGTVRNKAVYVALGVRADGSKEILGLWIERTPRETSFFEVYLSSFGPTNGGGVDCRSSRGFGAWRIACASFLRRVIRWRSCGRSSISSCSGRFSWKREVPASAPRVVGRRSMRF
jgi:transposase-like protein